MSRLKIKKYEASDALVVGIDPWDRPYADINETAGPAITVYEGDKILGVAGIRIDTIGELWGAFTPEAIERKVRLLRTAQVAVTNMSVGLLRVVATAKDQTPQQENFLKHLGFVKREMFVLEVDQ